MRKICTLTALTVLSMITYGQDHTEKHTTESTHTNGEFHNHSFVEAQTLFASTHEGIEIENALNVHLSFYEEDRKVGFGVIAWRSREEKYFTMGLTTRFKFLKGDMELFGCVGLEQTRLPIRGIVSFHFVNQKHNLTCHASIERGGYDWFYGANVALKVSEHFDAGIHTQRFLITGPWLVYKPMDTIHVWVAAGVDPEHTFSYGEASSEKHLQWEIACGLRCNLFASH